MTKGLVKGILVLVEVTNVYEAKTHLSRLLRRVRAGEEIIIAEAGRPVARLVPIAPPAGPRSLGGDEEQVWIADDFDAPLPDELVETFYGNTGREGLEVARPAGRRAAANAAKKAVASRAKRAVAPGRKEKATAKARTAPRRSV